MPRALSWMQGILFIVILNFYVHGVPALPLEMSFIRTWTYMLNICFWSTPVQITRNIIHSPIKLTIEKSLYFQCFKWRTNCGVDPAVTGFMKSVGIGAECYNLTGSLISGGEEALLCHALICYYIERYCLMD